MGRSLKPLTTASCGHAEFTTHSALYTDNSAALQLCTLDSGSWRTRHLRLRGHMIREAIERGEWTAAHLEAVYMPADIGTKPLGAARFEDLVSILGLHSPHLPVSSHPPNPKVASIQTSIAKVLIALIVASQAGTATAMKMEHRFEENMSLSTLLLQGFVLGFGGYFGWTVARHLHRKLEELCGARHRRPMCSESRHRPGHSREAQMEGRSAERLEVQRQNEVRHHISHRYAALMDLRSTIALPEPFSDRPVALLDLQPPNALRSISSSLLGTGATLPGSRRHGPPWLRYSAFRCLSAEATSQILAPTPKQSSLLFRLLVTWYVCCFRACRRTTPLPS